MLSGIITEVLGWNIISHRQILLSKLLLSPKEYLASHIYFISHLLHPFLTGIDTFLKHAKGYFITIPRYIFRHSVTCKAFFLSSTVLISIRVTLCTNLTLVRGPCILELISLQEGVHATDHISVERHIYCEVFSNTDQLAGASVCEVTSKNSVSTISKLHEERVE